MSTFSQAALDTMKKILNDDPSLAILGNKDFSSFLVPAQKAKTRMSGSHFGRDGRSNPNYKKIPREAVIDALIEAKTIKEAAKNAGVSVDCFRNKMSEYGIKKEKKSERKTVS